MRIRQLSIRARNVLLLVFALLGLGFAGVLAWNSHVTFRTTVVSQAHGQLLTTAKSVSLSIRQAIVLLSDALHLISHSDAVQQALRRGDSRAVPARELDTMMHDNKLHAMELSLFDAAGRVLYRSAAEAGDSSVPGDVTDLHDVNRMLRDRAPFISAPFASGAGDLVFSINQPVFAEGVFVGAVRWLISVRELVDVFVMPVRVGKSGYALLVDEGGTLLALPDAAQIGRPFLEKARRIYPDRDWSEAEGLLAHIDDSEGTATVDMVCWDADDCRDQINTKLVAFAPVRFGDNRWSLIMTLDGAEVAAPIDEHSRWQLGTVVLLLAVTALAGVHRLTSERAAALAAGERKFRTLFENMAEGVALHEVVYDDSGTAVDYRILEINPAYERHTGLAAATARGALASDLYGTGAPPHLDLFTAVADGGPPHFFETYFAPLARHFSISVISPRFGQFATVFEDVTARKQREEELREKNVEHERFIHMISHDLKSPLVTVKTFLGYLEQDLARADETKVAQDIAYISAAAGKMGTLLDELLEFSRVGRSVNPPSRVSFNELVDEARSLVAGRIAERGVSIAAYETGVVLFGDRQRLVEIWQNLIDNAVKYLGAQAAPRVEIGVATTSGEPVFFVRDNGIGIEGGYREKVFGLFEKLDPSSEGTGLGLALVRRIVTLYGGTIRLESGGSGTGSCFSFTLPLAVAPPDGVE